ncbi:MAG: hypothetical protein MZV63_64850 [Marinilabiliales bacterium]|nr:hypothetical protein [Marinilabiliales bacterium]
MVKGSLPARSGPPWPGRSSLLVCPGPRPRRPVPDARPNGGPAWWEVRLLVVRRGRIPAPGRSGERRPVTGIYAFRARWEGRLEPDEDDFLLVHLKTEVLEWRLTERAGPGAARRVLETPDTPAPDLRLNYVLQDGKTVEFDFGLDGARAVPLCDLRPRSALSLPRRRAAGRLAGRAYDDLRVTAARTASSFRPRTSRRRPAERTLLLGMASANGPLRRGRVTASRAATRSRRPSPWPAH